MMQPKGPLPPRGQTHGATQSWTSSPKAVKLNKCLWFIHYSASVLWYNHGKWANTKVSFILWVCIIDTKCPPGPQKEARFSMKYTASESDVVLLPPSATISSRKVVSTLSCRALLPADVLSMHQLCQQRSLRQNRSLGMPNRDFLL